MLLTDPPLAGAQCSDTRSWPPERCQPCRPGRVQPSCYPSCRPPTAWSSGRSPGPLWALSAGPHGRRLSCLRGLLLLTPLPTRRLTIHRDAGAAVGSSVVSFGHVQPRPRRASRPSVRRVADIAGQARSAVRRTRKRVRVTLRGSKSAATASLTTPNAGRAATWAPPFLAVVQMWSQLLPIDAPLLEHRRPSRLARCWVAAAAPTATGRVI